MEIVPGVHLVDNVRGANCYLIADGSSITIVDTGLPGSSQKITEYVGRLGKNVRQIEHIILMT